MCGQGGPTGTTKYSIKIAFNALNRTWVNAFNSRHTGVEAGVNDFCQFSSHLAGLEKPAASSQIGLWIPAAAAFLFQR